MGSDRRQAQRKQADERRAGEQVGDLEVHVAAELAPFPLHHCVELLRNAVVGWDFPTDLARFAALIVFGLILWRDAWLEDPKLNEETWLVLEPHRDRITWDAAIHAPEDVDALPFPPRCLNSKASRFGTVRKLFDFYDLCEERGIAVYGGGQFELGQGRGQIQHLASLFHSDGPNDVAPREYNFEPKPGLPRSPLPRPEGDPGFR